MSYPVSGLGKPQGGGAFPLWEDVDFLGGFQVQPTTTARDAIPLLNQKVGMWCWVTAAGGTLYQLTATGTPGTWAAVSLGGAPSGAAGGDLGGTFPNPSVLKIRGIPITAGTPGEGQLLTGNGLGGAAWAPPPSGFTAGGDLTGSSTNQTVAKMNGVTISNAPGAAGWAFISTSTTAGSWTAPPSGTGLVFYTAGVRSATARPFNLASDIDPATELPAANGGGKVLWPTQSTSTGTPVLLASTPVVSTGAGVSVFGHVMFDDGAGNLYDQVAQGLYKNVGGTISGVFTPTPPNGNGPLLGCAISFAINNTTKKIELYGTLSGTAIGTTINMVPELTYTVR